MTAGIAHRSRTGGAWVLLMLGVALAAAVARTLIVARLLGPAEIGTVAIALLALGVLEAVTASGLDTALVSQRGDVERDLDPAFTVQAVRGALVAMVLWTAAPAVGWLFDNAGAIPVVRGISVVAALKGLSNPAAYMLSRRFEFQRLFWWSLPEILTSLVLSAVLAYIRRDVTALVIAAVGAQVVATLASYGMAPRRPRFSREWARARRLLHFGKWVSGARALTHFSVTADAMIVGSTLGTTALGLYQFAYRMAELPVLMFSGAIGRVALPAFTELQGQPGHLWRAYRIALLTAFGINVAFAAGIVMFGGAAVEWLVGPQWLPAVPALHILALSMVFRAVVIVSNRFFDAARQPRLTLITSAVRLATLLIAIAPLASRYGIQGAAAAVLVSTLITAGVCLWLVPTPSNENHESAVAPLEAEGIADS